MGYEAFTRIVDDLGMDVEEHCRYQIKIFVAQDKQLLRSLENSILIDNVRGTR